MGFHYTREMEKAIHQQVDELGIEVLVVEFSQMAGFDFPSGIPLVIDEHNVEFDLLRRMAKQDKFSFRKVFNLLEAAKFKREELECLGRADLVMVTSERDESLLKSLVPGLHTTVVTNGVDTDYFRRPHNHRQPNTAVFVGATHYFPNEEGVLFFVEKILPQIRQRIPDFRFTVVGGNPPPPILAHRSDSIIVTGFVDDVRPYMWESSVFVVPLRMGGGTRFKIVEALAAGIPVVSTTLGAEGIPAIHGREVLLADSPEDFAEAVIKVLTEPSKTHEMTDAGISFVLERFDWKVVGRTMQRALTTLLQGKK
jgi:glycosyltransferase involved in cell wall biosynthesis